MQPAPWLTVTVIATANAGSSAAPAMLDGHECRTRAAFFEQAARVLDFPAYFGHNWDALLDSLRDTGAVALTVSRGEELLADEPMSQLVILLRIMATIAADGSTLTLLTTPEQQASVLQRIETALRG